jgi:hypothetical protein
MLNLITVSVGPTNTTFSIHEAIIRKSSEFFDDAMKPEEASTRSDPRVINLSNEDPEIFKIYLNWLYCKTLPTVVASKEESESEPESEYILLSKSYVMGERLMDTGFKDALLDAFADCVENQPTSDARIPGSNPINIIYVGTKEKSPARQLLVSMWVFYADKDWAEYVNDNLPHAFVLDFSRAIILQKCRLEGELRAVEDCLMEN